MTINVLQKPQFFQFLPAIDSDLASRAQLQGCSVRDLRQRDAASFNNSGIHGPRLIEINS